MSKRKKLLLQFLSRSTEVFDQSWSFFMQVFLLKKVVAKGMQVVRLKQHAFMHVSFKVQGSQKQRWNKCSSYHTHKKRILLDFCKYLKQKAIPPKKYFSSGNSHQLTWEEIYNSYSIISSLNKCVCAHELLSLEGPVLDLKRSLLSSSEGCLRART